MTDNNDTQTDDRTLAAKNAWQLSLRQRAEDNHEQADVQADLIQGMSYDDAQVMFHELRVHQIELELQNEELRRTQFELSMLHDRYFDLYDLAPVGYCMVDQSGKILEANLTMATLLGLTRNLLCERSFARFVAGSQQDTYYLFSKKVFETDLTQTCELEMVKGDKTLIWVSLAATPALDTDGSKVMRLTLSDVTLRKHLDDELQQTITELQHARQAADKANQAKSEFLANMSHDLRSPLNAILGFAQLLELGSPEPTARQKASLNQILHNGWYLLELISGILDLASIESGKLSMVMESMLLSDVLLDCQTMIDLQAQQSGIDVHFQPCAEPCLLHADRTRVKQVLVNLLSNAIKYNRPKGTVNVTYSTPSPQMVRISVQDNGPGLNAEKLSQLFQPFNRLGQEIGGKEGTGIGLVVCRRLVELMGGTIGVQSTVGEGSVFWFELVRDSATVPALNATSTPELPSCISPVHTVLYIEDNEANIALMEQLIECRPGLQLLSAADATLGMAMAQRHLPNLILMDINLPGINGIQALKILRDDTATRHIPVMAISANAMPRDIEKGLAAGFSDYLTKPINVPKFLAALDHGLALGVGLQGSP